MKLRALINVFNVWPDFLQPLFSENDDFYFQKQKRPQGLFIFGGCGRTRTADPYDVNVVL